MIHSLTTRFQTDESRCNATLVSPHSTFQIQRQTLFVQAHMARLPAPISDYVTDTKSVLDQSLRVLQAMTDVSADAGWLDTALATMMLVQSLMQVSPLLLLPSFGLPILSFFGLPILSSFGLRVLAAALQLAVCRA